MINNSEDAENNREYRMILTSDFLNKRITNFVATSHARRKKGLKEKKKKDYLKNWLSLHSYEGDHGCDSLPFEF